MIGRILTFAITTGLAKKAWDHYRDGHRRPPEDITDLVARPEAVDPARRGRKKSAPGRRSGGPGA